MWVTLTIRRDWLVVPPRYAIACCTLPYIIYLYVCAGYSLFKDGIFSYYNSSVRHYFLYIGLFSQQQHVLVTSLLSVYAPRYVIPSCVQSACIVHFDLGTPLFCVLCPTLFISMSVFAILRSKMTFSPLPTIIPRHAITFRVFSLFFMTSLLSAYSPRYVIPLCGPSDEQTQQMTSRAVRLNWTLTTQYRTKLTAKLTRNRQLMTTVAIW